MSFDTTKRKQYSNGKAREIWLRIALSNVDERVSTLHEK
jgi:hypothetical protein